MDFLFTTCIKHEGPHQFFRLEQTVLKKSEDYMGFITSRPLYSLIYIFRERNSHIRFQCIYFNYIYQTSQII
jgi:hypothetical protein